jgi:hypothetical protein
MPIKHTKIYIVETQAVRSTYHEICGHEVKIQFLNFQIIMIYPNSMLDALNGICYHPLLRNCKEEML